MIVWMLFIVVVASFLSWWYYKGQQKNALEGIGRPAFTLLVVFRFLGLFLIGLLLLGYVFKNQVDEKQEPVVLVLSDNSQSIVFNKDSAYFRSEFPKAFDAVLQQLEAQTTVESFIFGADLIEEPTLNFTEPLTNLDAALEGLYNKFYGRNIGAVVLATDGLFNQGASPLYASSLIDLVPIYTIGMGDTTQQKDLFIQEVEHNELAFLGNDFLIKAHIQAHLLKDASYELTLLHNGKVIDQENLNVDSSFYNRSESWQIGAEEVGVQKYDIVLSRIEGEITYENNIQSIYINVVDSRQKVLLLASSPHPDVGAIKAALIHNKNYEVEVKFIDQSASISTDYSLMIWLGLPSAKVSVPEQLVSSKIPRVIVVGASTDLGALAEIQDGFKAINASSGVESVQAKINESFSNFKIDGNWKKVIENYPPVFSPYANLGWGGDVDVLAFQSVASIQKDNPLILLNTLNGVKTCYIMGEGIWRWRLNEGKNEESASVFDGLIQKLVQITANKEDLSRLRIQVEEELNEQESVQLYGEFYNDALELINTPELLLNLVNRDNGEEFEYSFLKTGEVYRIDLGALTPGSYSWSANLQFKGEQYSKSGVFKVTKVDRESLVTKADHQLLRDVAEKSGGQYLHHSELSALPDLIKAEPNIQTVVYQTEEITELIDWKILLFVVVFVFGMEWFLRKYYGAL